MTSQAIRMSRIITLMNKIEGLNRVGLGYYKDKLIADFSLELGISRRTILEYLENLKLSGKILEISKNGWEKPELWVASLYQMIEGPKITTKKQLQEDICKDLKENLEF